MFTKTIDDGKHIANILRRLADKIEAGDKTQLVALIQERTEPNFDTWDGVGFSARAVAGPRAYVIEITPDGRHDLQWIKCALDDLPPVNSTPT